MSFLYIEPSTILSKKYDLKFKPFIGTVLHTRSATQASSSQVACAVPPGYRATCWWYPWGTFASAWRCKTGRLLTCPQTPVPYVSWWPRSQTDWMGGVLQQHSLSSCQSARRGPVEWRPSPCWRATSSGRAVRGSPYDYWSKSTANALIVFFLLADTCP